MEVMELLRALGSDLPQIPEWIVIVQRPACGSIEDDCNSAPGGGDGVAVMRENLQHI